MEKKNYKKWTAEETLYLRQNWMTETDEVIGRKFGKTTNAVFRKRMRLGLSKAKGILTYSQKMELMARIERGEKPWAIKKDYGVSLTSLLATVGRLYAQRFAKKTN